MKGLKFLIVAVILAVIAFSYWVYSSLHTPNAHDKGNQYIQIQHGSSPGQILAKLAAEGIISSQTPLKIYMKVTGTGNEMQAGEYQFDSPITPLEVLEKLRKGKLRTVKLIVPEGFTRFDIAKRIVGEFPQNKPAGEDSVLDLMNDNSLIKDIAPEAKSLEGYMYPNTYDFPRAVNTEAILKKMVEEFRKVWKPEYASRAAKLKLTSHQVITIASLIETESRLDEERPVVASVIYNRLKKGMPLGIDQTAVYIAKMEHRWDGVINRSDLESASPYNTRKVVGLPPGPISSVSKSSIKAALYPASTNYIYYVLNVEKNDKSHNFYSSAADFERGKAAYQAWLAKERK
ncbi:endolytic transglycosylase MltG [Mucilaginibacter terrenus]|uniref:Endolytic murein transglycosylase n=1 Tax=Mucilaginibacter terrenus TaxID=2482727 RepID=A0A3E2NP29_9SPHI|nr:endolytic transglycosylase MltG [Mucilaginibacter terrenus]RFZ82766.1 endolytic transglycosylase MltG [Mucilaginibacter terrenus]